MATSQQFLVCDSSTLANFKQWAQAISGFFTTAGWSQAADTGQVNWGTIVSVPGSGAYVYEVWQPNDGLTTFYLKVEYGNTSGTNSPGLRLTISSSTNGAGTATGLIIGPIKAATSATTPPSTSTQYECNFSGAAGRMCIMMWRNTPNSNQQVFTVERALNVSGAYQSTYVTLCTVGLCPGNNSNTYQQSLMFGVGVAPALVQGSNAVGGLNVRGFGGGVAGVFNGSIPVDFAAPYVGLHDFPMTVIGSMAASDVTEGVPFSVTLYGSTRTFMPSKLGPFVGTGPACIGASYAVAMRYD